MSVVYTVTVHIIVRTIAISMSVPVPLDAQPEPARVKLKNGVPHHSFTTTDDPTKNILQRVATYLRTWKPETRPVVSVTNNGVYTETVDQIKPKDTEATSKVGYVFIGVLHLLAYVINEVVAKGDNKWMSAVPLPVLVPHVVVSILQLFAHALNTQIHQTHPQHLNWTIVAFMTTTIAVAGYNALAKDGILSILHAYPYEEYEDPELYTADVGVAHNRTSSSV